MPKSGQLFDNLLQRAEQRHAHCCSHNDSYCTKLPRRSSRGYLEAFVRDGAQVDMHKDCTENDQSALERMCFTNGTVLTMEFTLLEKKVKLKKFKKRKRTSGECQRKDLRAKEGASTVALLGESNRSNGIRHKPRDSSSRFLSLATIEKSKWGGLKRSTRGSRGARRRSSATIGRGLWADGLIDIDLEKHTLKMKKGAARTGADVGVIDVTAVDNDSSWDRIEVQIPTAEKVLQGNKKTPSKRPKQRRAAINSGSSGAAKRMYKKRGASSTSKRSSTKAPTPKKSTQFALQYEAALKREKLALADHERRITKQVDQRKYSSHQHGIRGPHKRGAPHSLKYRTREKRKRSSDVTQERAVQGQAKFILTDLTLDADDRSFVHGDYCGFGENPYQCLECARRLPSLCKLRAHLMVKHKMKWQDVFIMDSSLKCPVAHCGASLSTLVSLNNHIDVVHPTTPEVLQTYHCRHCSALFPSWKALRKHMSALYKSTVLINMKNMSMALKSSGDEV